MPKFRAFVEPGKYEVSVVGAKSSVSKKGNQMITLRLSVEGAHRLFSDHLVFTESSFWKVADFLIAMGHPPSGEVDLDFDPQNYVGCTAVALVGVEEFNGRSQNKIERWLPPTSTPTQEKSKRS